MIAEAVPARQVHAYYIASRLRDADRREVKACGYDPLTGVLLSVRASETCFTILYDREPVGIFGLTTDGRIWMVGTDAITKRPLSFLRQCRKWIDLFQQDHPRLWNFVHEHNHVHIRWLKWLGFNFKKLHYGYGVDGTGFWEFERCASPTH